MKSQIGGPDGKNHIHLRTIPQWQEAAQNKHIAEKATVAQPTILSITSQYSKYVVYLDVGYNLAVEINGLLGFISS